MPCMLIISNNSYNGVAVISQVTINTHFRMLILAVGGDIAFGSLDLRKNCQEIKRILKNLESKLTDEVSSLNKKGEIFIFIFGIHLL